MKKLIGLFFVLVVGSYGAMVITPPGIQVEGLATNNNVMVYQDGALIDSGVAPTNLVSVTNLTADIEELQAGAIDATLWASVSDAATNALDSVAMVVDSDGNTTLYTDFDLVQNADLNDKTIHLLTDISLTDNWWAYGTNITVLGHGNTVTVVMTGLGSNRVGTSAVGVEGTNIVWDALNVRAQFKSGYSTSSEQYTFVCRSNKAKDILVKNSTFQLENYIDSDPGMAKTWVSVASNFNIRVVNCDIVSIHTNRVDTNGSLLATHDSADTVTFDACNFVASSNAGPFSAAVSVAEYINCRANLLTHLADGPEGMGHETAMAHIIRGTEYMFNDNESTASTISTKATRIYSATEFFSISDNATLTSTYQYNGSNATGYRYLGFEIGSNVNTQVAVPLYSADFDGAVDLEARTLYLTIEETTFGTKFQFSGFDGGTDFTTRTYFETDDVASLTIGADGEMRIEWGDWNQITSSTGPLSSDWSGYLSFGTFGTAPDQKFLILGCEVRAK